MKIAGFTKNSFVDYPGRIASVIFFAGCNYDCFFCHNRGILDPKAPTVDEEPIWEFLQRRRGLLDAVVLTGGEPALQPGLQEFAARIKSLGYLCKLDTNGAWPEVVRTLIGAGLVDYVALDIKAPWDRYNEYCGPAAEPRAVLETLALLRDSQIDYECRTTFLPQLTPEDIGQMAASIAPVKRYALQAYRIPPAYKPTDRFRVLSAGHDGEAMRRAMDEAAKCGGEVILRA
jgi:pyruvate formate lyase activating enzyme